MTIISNTLNAIGLVLLTHAVYSAYEHALQPPPRTVSTEAPFITTAASSVPVYTPVPIDITIETLTSVLLLCVGIVLGAPELKPIQWRVWAGKIEKEKRRPLKNLDEGLGGNPYIGLEQRVGFVDIRRQRREFAEWVKEGKS